MTKLTRSLTARGDKRRRWPHQDRRGSSLRDNPLPSLARAVARHSLRRRGSPSPLPLPSQAGVVSLVRSQFLCPLENMEVPPITWTTTTTFGVVVIVETGGKWCTAKYQNLRLQLLLCGTASTNKHGWEHPISFMTTWEIFDTNRFFQRGKMTLKDKFLVSACGLFQRTECISHFFQRQTGIMIWDSGLAHSHEKTTTWLYFLKHAVQL